VLKHFLFILLFFSGSAFANQYMYGSPALVSVSTINANIPYPVSTSVSVLGQNTNRAYLLVQNSGTNAAFFSLGAPKAASASFVLAAGGNYEPIYPPGNQIFMIVPTGAYVTIMEGN
jgi:hypothetical protein